VPVAARERGLSDRYRRALAQYRQHLAEHPDDARTLLKVGDLHQMLDEIVEAVAAYDHAAEVFSRDGGSGGHLKAIDVSKQVLQIIEDRAPAEARRLVTLVPRMVASCRALGREADAAQLCDRGAACLERAGLSGEAAELRRQATTLRRATDKR
jgi:hypothetical protein